MILAKKTIHIWLVSALTMTWSLPALGLKVVLGQKHVRFDKTALTLIKKVTGEPGQCIKQSYSRRGDPRKDFYTFFLEVRT